MSPSETGFSIVGSEVATSTGYLEIERLEIQAPDGSHHERSVVRHPGAVSVVAVEPSGTRTLLVRQYRASIDRELLEVPAGKRDVDGEPPAVTAARELDEEVGHRPGRLVKLAEFHNSPGFCDEAVWVFLGMGLTEVPPHRQGPEEEAMVVHRVPLTEALAMIADGRITDAKTVIGLTLAAGRTP